MERERVTTIVGEPGTGKSRLARSFMRAEHRLILIDTMAEHDEFRLVDLWELRELVEDNGPFRVRVLPRGDEELDWVCQLAAWRPHVCLVVEEYSLHWRRAQAAPPNGLLDIVRVGRKLDQSAILIAQSPTSIDKTLVEFGTLFAFRLRGLRARKYVMDFTDGVADPGTLAFDPPDTSDFWHIHMGVPSLGRFDLRNCVTFPLTRATPGDSLPCVDVDAQAASESPEGENDEDGCEVRGDGGGNRARDDDSGAVRGEARSARGGPDLEPDDAEDTDGA